MQLCPDKRILGCFPCVQSDLLQFAFFLHRQSARKTPPFLTNAEGGARYARDAYLLILARGFGLLSNSKAELITTDMQLASARTTARTGFRMPKAAKLNATMFQMKA